MHGAKGVTRVSDTAGYNKMFRIGRERRSRLVCLRQMKRSAMASQQRRPTTYLFLSRGELAPQFASKLAHLHGAEGGWDLASLTFLCGESKEGGRGASRLEISRNSILLLAMGEAIPVELVDGVQADGMCPLVISRDPLLSELLGATGVFLTLCIGERLPVTGQSGSGGCNGLTRTEGGTWLCVARLDKKRICGRSPRGWRRNCLEFFLLRLEIFLLLLECDFRFVLFELLRCKPLEFSRQSAPFELLGCVRLLSCCSLAFGSCLFLSRNLLLSRWFLRRWFLRC